MRRVCNAASEFEGQSLNKSLVIGPDLLQNLVGIIFWFREKSFVMSANIEAMFLQVQVPADDANCLRFVWRENQSEGICGTYALQRTATGNEEEFPVASRMVN